MANEHEEAVYLRGILKILGWSEASPASMRGISSKSATGNLKLY